MSPELSRLIERFAAAHTGLSTRRGSFSKCRAATADFLRMASDAGLEGFQVRLAEGTASWPDADKRWHEIGSPFWWVHYVPVIEGLAIDFTARQFDPAAPFPLVCELEDMAAGWETCERTASAQDNTPVENMKSSTTARI